MAPLIKIILTSVVVLLITSSVRGQEEPTVEIAEFWGTVSIPAGKLGMYWHIFIVPFKIEYKK